MKRNSKTRALTVSIPTTIQKLNLDNDFLITKRIQMITSTPVLKSNSLIVALIYFHSCKNSFKLPHIFEPLSYSALYSNQ